MFNFREQAMTHHAVHQYLQVLFLWYSHRILGGGSWSAVYSYQCALYFISCCNFLAQKNKRLEGNVEKAKVKKGKQRSLR